MKSVVCELDKVEWKPLTISVDTGSEFNTMVTPSTTIYYKGEDRKSPFGLCELLCYREGEDTKTHRTVYGPQFFVLVIGFATSAQDIEDILHQNKLSQELVEKKAFNAFKEHISIKGWQHFDRCGLSRGKK